MYKKTELKLKNVDLSNPDTERIYNLTKQSIDLLNNYIVDFIETISILNDDKSKLSKKSKKKLQEIESSITFVEGRIGEVSESMYAMAKEMPELIELEEHGDEE